MKHSVYTFDLDGVITDPTDSSVDEQAVRHIHGLLQSGVYVAVNTGRSYVWVAEHLLKALEYLDGPDAFGKLYITCEKGGESIMWAGGVFTPQPSRFALPGSLHAICHQVFAEGEAVFSTMFWDATKQTMATIEKRPEANLPAFQAQQQTLVQALQTALRTQDVTIDATTIATDVQSPQAGKHAGAELIYAWVAAAAGNTDLDFISFGDSKSDYEMARYFAEQDARSTFVFVGEDSVVFSEHTSVELIRTTRHYAAGTREYFEQ